jgi:uncharacterized protein
MKPVFVDTTYYIGLLNARDEYHERAVAFTRAFGGSFVTTAWVLIEVANYLAGSDSRSEFASLVADLRSDARVHIIFPTEVMFDRGIELYSKRLDKQWSLTDCISFLVMEDEEITDALTADHHFEQAGFAVLLK